MENRKDLITEVKQKAKDFLAHRRHANNLIDILFLSETDDVKVLTACLKALHEIFVCTFQQKDVFIEKPVPEEDSGAFCKYKQWMKERYQQTYNRLVELLVYPQKSIQELSMSTLMKFVQLEAESPVKKISSKHSGFLMEKIQGITKQLLSSEITQEELIRRFQEYTEYDDIRYYTMKTALVHLQSMKNKPGAAFLENMCCLLENLSMPIQQDSDKLSNTLTIVQDTKKGPSRVISLNEHKKLFSSCWLEFLQCELPNNVYKRVLVNLHEKVIPFMSSPILLSDFLTRSYNTGGVISLLALNGLFILVNSYNLNYPDFYTKLYSLLDPAVCHVIYRARFFFLLDLFLTSSHIPAYLVAAFAKRLSRIALSAPPASILLIIPLVCNLIKRHPACRCLLNRPDGPKDITDDPFKAEEADPEKCEAMQSCLWELQALQSHHHHSVATEAKKIDVPLPKEETDISDKLELTTNDIFQREVKKKVKVIPTTFHPPKGLFLHQDNVMKDLWTINGV